MATTHDGGLVGNHSEGLIMEGISIFVKAVSPKDDGLTIGRIALSLNMDRTDQQQEQGECQSNFFHTRITYQYGRIRQRHDR